MSTSAIAETNTGISNAKLGIWSFLASEIMLFGGLISARWHTAFPDPALAPLGLSGWQAAFLAVGIPGLLIALWVLSLREPQRGASDRLPQPVVRPNAWRDFGLELVAILPPLTLFNAARNPGGLGANLTVLAILIAAGSGVYLLGGGVPLLFGLGVYAIFTWVQALKHRDISALRLNLIVFATLVAWAGLYRLTDDGSRRAGYGNRHLCDSLVRRPM